tara:strand:+ start:157 stop:330 length:174 start_codon:yes stop_codon:yes gene_type:complete
LCCDSFNFNYVHHDVYQFCYIGDEQEQHEEEGEHGEWEEQSPTAEVSNIVDDMERAV